jgi:hypothetical protein
LVNAVTALNNTKKEKDKKKDRAHAARSVDWAPLDAHPPLLLCARPSQPVETDEATSAGLLIVTAGTLRTARALGQTNKQCREKRSKG